MGVGPQLMAINTSHSLFFTLYKTEYPACVESGIRTCEVVRLRQSSAGLERRGCLASGRSTP